MDSSIPVAVTSMRAAFPDINLLPSEQRRDRLRSTRAWRMTGILFILATLSLVPLILVRSYNMNAVEELAKQVQQQRREAAHVEGLLAEREQTLRELTAILRRTDTFENQAAQLARAGPPISLSLHAIDEVLPPRVTVIAIYDQGAFLRLRGQAGSASLVVEFAQTLEAASGGQRVVIERLSTVGDNVDQLDPERSVDAPPGAVEFVLTMEK